MKYLILIFIMFPLLTWAEEPFGPPIASEPAPTPETEKEVPEKKAEPEPPKEEKVIAVVYVTDKLILGMKDNPEGSGKNLKLLRSGTRLEVLERQGPFSKVRTPEGLVGWAKTTFMVNDKPAILMVKELETENKELRKEIEKLKKASGKTQIKEKIVEVEADPEQKQRLLELEMALEEAKKQLEEQEIQLAEQGSVSEYTQKEGISFKLMLITLLAGLLTGAGFTFYYFQQRMRKRFAGMKV
jgi:SH3 domain protein